MYGVCEMRRGVGEYFEIERTLRKGCYVTVALGRVIRRANEKTNRKEEETVG